MLECLADRQLIADRESQETCGELLAEISRESRVLERTDRW
jgi:hypothetical protein